MNEQPQELYIDVKKVSEELRIRPEVYLKIVKSFANSLMQKMNALSDALAVEDREQARMILHEIKGTSSNLRLHNVSQAEGIIHAAVKSGAGRDQLDKHFEALRKEAERLQQYVYKLTGDA